MLSDILLHTNTGNGLAGTVQIVEARATHHIHRSSNPMIMLLPWQAEPVRLKPRGRMGDAS